MGVVPANRLGEFLRARRAAAEPPPDQPLQRKRRTPGLRREEVAARAAISADYYTRLEQGRERNPSPHVLDAIATALELSPTEIGYLHNLVTPPPIPPVAPADEPPNVFLDLVMRAWTLGPAYIVNHRTDVVAANPLAQQLFARFEHSDNVLRMIFLDPAAPRIWANWDTFARYLVGGVRRLIGPVAGDDPEITTMLADLSAASPAFAEFWAKHEISVPGAIFKRYNDDDRGEISLDFELLTAIDTPHQHLVLHRTLGA